MVSRPTRARGLKLKRYNRHWRPRVSRPTRARGLKQTNARQSGIEASSRPTRARGLKRIKLIASDDLTMSRPTRARGLKLSNPGLTKAPHTVAPHAGAWIETVMFRSGGPYRSVAPHAGAWIETHTYRLNGIPVPSSRPTRARGLKLRFGSRTKKEPPSRPTRARGLKQGVYRAPLAG